MSALEIYAGPRAKSQIEENGLDPAQFSLLVGASGGPKWFVLYGLDRFLFGEYFAGRDKPLMTLGSSAGAWRLCCLGTATPLRAIDALAARYSRETYSAQPTVEEITEKMRSMLTAALGSSGAGEIAANQLIQTHIVADRCKGFAGSESANLQKLSLAGSAIANVFSRRSLSWFFQRTIFTNMRASGPDQSPFCSLNDLDTTIVPLTEENVSEAMLASGSIPFLLKGVRSVKGAPEGLYWDGGITDYHFDLPFHLIEGLVLYPHFSPTIKPGWFDKKLFWRHPTLEHFDNVVVVTPSAEFTARLPGGKIPDRNDFQRYSEGERLANWSRVLDSSHELALEFAELVKNPDRLVVRDFSERPV